MSFFSSVDSLQYDHVLETKANWIVECYANKYDESIKQIFEETTTENESQVLVEIDRVEVNRKSFQRLKSKGWLNDTIIDAYMKLLGQKYDRVHFCSNFFYTKLTEVGENYEKINRWFKNVDIKSKKMIIFPVNIQNSHWTLLLIDIQGKTISYLDSYGDTGSTATKTILKWFKQYCKTKDISIIEDEWTSKNIQVPSQHNCSDCGVFILMYAEFVADGCLNPQTFSEKDMGYFRTIIAINILRGTINYVF